MLKRNKRMERAGDAWDGETAEEWERCFVPEPLTKHVAFGATEVDEMVELLLRLHHAIGEARASRNTTAPVAELVDVADEVAEKLDPLFQT